MSKPATDSRRGATARYLTPSLLDRLLDDKPAPREQSSERQRAVLQRGKQEPEREYLFDLDTYRQRLRKDLNNLVQTFRPAMNPATAKLSELQRSIFAYGLPDITSYGTTTENVARLAHDLGRAIEYFEPRLRNVHVTVDGHPELGEAVRLSIRALLLIEPAPEQIHFAASLSAHIQLIQLTEQNRGAGDG